MIRERDRGIRSRKSGGAVQGGKGTQMPTRRSAAKPRTFAQTGGSRVTVPDSARRARSFNLPEALVARAAAAMRGTQARAYGTELDGEVPDSLTRFVEEAVQAACTYYEDLFNGGEQFPPAQLSAGPGPRGAVEGAVKRAEKLAAARRPGGEQAPGTEQAKPGRRRAGAAT